MTLVLSSGVDDLQQRWRRLGELTGCSDDELMVANGGKL